MSAHSGTARGRDCSWRKVGTRSAGIALLAAGLLLGTGCGDEIQKEFRAAAVGSIESGIGQIADGIISGIFAVAEVDGGSGSSSSSSASSGTSTAGTSDAAAAE